MATAVIIKLEVFIPSEVVTYYAFGYGGTFNGGMKCNPAPVIDLDVAGSGSLTFSAPEWGETRAYDDADAIEVPGKPDWFRTLKPGAAVTEQGTLARTTDNLDAKFRAPDGATHGVFFKVVGANPLLSIAPAIDAEITVGLRKGGGGIEYMVDGAHDGFPDYRLSLDGKVVYAHDCVAKGETPGALKPWMDYSVDIGWKAL